MAMEGATATQDTLDSTVMRWVGRMHADRRVGGMHMWVQFDYSDRYRCTTKWQHWSLSVHGKHKLLNFP